MCPFDEQQLDQMLAKPMPKLSAEEFTQQTVERLNKIDAWRKKVLQATIILATLVLAYFIPGKEVVLELFSFNVFDIYEINFNQVNSVMLIISQLMLAAMLVFIFKDEI